MSDYLDPNNEELLKDFFSEAQMQVDTLEQNILIIENEGANKDAVDEIFRAAHTLKGGSATVEFMELSHFTHMVEDVLDAIRSDQLHVKEEVVDTLLTAIDVIKAMLEQRMNGSVYGENTSAIEGKLESLIPHSKKGGGAPKSAAAPVPVRAIAPRVPVTAPVAVNLKPSTLTEDEFNEIKGASEGNLPIFRVSVTFDEKGIMNTVGGIQIYAVLKDYGTILKTVPDFEALYEDNFFPVVDYYVSTDKKPEDLRRAIVLPDVSLDAKVININELTSAEKTDIASQPAAFVSAAASKPTASARSAAEASRPQEADSVPVAAAQSSAASADAKKAGKEAGSILRVDSKRIDDLLNLVSETVITKATFNQINNQFNELLTELHVLENTYRDKIKSLFDRLPGYLESIQEGGKTVKDIRKEINEEYGDTFTLFDSFENSVKTNIAKFRSTSQNLGRITGELQEGVMRIRMVPISQIFSRFPRLVRDLSKSLNKKINLVIEGEETELDKSVVEDLLDPIMHSVRNSIDHGIEGPAERIAAGKSEEGMVLLKATNEGNMIVIEIADDGKGIDVEEVKAKAIEKGLINPNKMLTDVEAFNLIFEPGFSTAKSITSISGRGVGLDVV
ncbi:MAG: chemotaxis protein CheA, partial [Treponema sp.]|nr:chemotaxis protein CheA [Treponema sp.]